MSLLDLEGLAGAMAAAPVRRRSGRVVRVVGTLVEADLPGARVGEVCRIEGSGAAETVGFREHRALLMPFNAVDGVRFGARVDTEGEMPSVPVGDSLRGRVLDGFGGPILCGFPSGHTAGPAWTLPLGVSVRVRAGANAGLLIEEPAVRS